MPAISSRYVRRACRSGPYDRSFRARGAASSGWTEDSSTGWQTLTRPFFLRTRGMSTRSNGKRSTLIKLSWCSGSGHSAASIQAARALAAVQFCPTGVPSCNFDWSLSYLARDDEIIFCTCLCTAVRASRNWGQVQLALRSQYSNVLMDSQPDPYFRGAGHTS